MRAGKAGGTRVWLAALAVMLAAGTGLAEPEPENLPRWVFTHAMGMMPAVNSFGANKLFPRTDYALARSRMRPEWSGDFAPGLGGQLRTTGLGFFYPFLRADSTYNFNEPYERLSVVLPIRASEDFGLYNRAHLEDAYRWDLEMAEEMGVDIFGLCLSGNEPSYRHAVGWFDSLEALLAARPETRLRLTIALCGDDMPSAAHPLKYAWLKRFMAERRDSPAWMRHRGRLVFMGYHNQITWSAETGVDLDHTRHAITVHQAFFRELDIDPIFIFDGAEYVPGQISASRTPGHPEMLKPVVELVCDAFDGYSVWGGIIREEEYRANYPVIAAAARGKGRLWMMPILNIHSGIGQFYRSRPGVQRLLETFAFAEQTGAGAVQLVTWNDSGEATGFQPSVSFNYALWALTAKLMHRFKHGAFPEPEQDSVFLFYRKYHPDADPYLYPRATVERDEEGWGRTDDQLHVIVFATAAGELEVTGVAGGVERRELVHGYNEFFFTTAVNAEIGARIRRDGRLAHELISPERVTDRPYREDLIPWGWSSYCRPFYDRDFGPNFRPLSDYSERHGDGIPDWFRLHYWGTTELRDGMRATDDPDGDGRDNRREYQDGTNPREADPRYAPGFVWDEWAQALRAIESGAGLDFPFAAAPRINKNPYPDKNGRLVHGFLYHDGEVFDGRYPYMHKWNNLVPGIRPGWTFRRSSGHDYSLDEDGRIAMNLRPGRAGIYRFWSPVRGTVRVVCEVTGDPETAVEFRVQDGPAVRFSTLVPAGRTARAELELTVGKWSRVDVIARASGGAPAAIRLKPEITLLALAPESYSAAAP